MVLMGLKDFFKKKIIFFLCILLYAMSECIHVNMYNIVDTENQFIFENQSNKKLFY